MRRRGAGGARRGGGLLGLGARFSHRGARALARLGGDDRGLRRASSTLMLALASLLERLRDDPGTVGKRYQLTVVGAGVHAAVDPRRRRASTPPARRYAVDAADSFRLGEPLRLVAYPGDHTEFEAPPLAEGRRVRGPGEVEVGLGLADALGLRPGSTLAAQLPSGAEVRFRVVGRRARAGERRPDRLGAAASGCSRATRASSRGSSCGSTRAPTAPRSRAR